MAVITADKSEEGGLWQWHLCLVGTQRLEVIL